MRKVNKGLHWSTVMSEKILLAIIGSFACVAAAQHLYGMWEIFRVELADLFMLFIYAEIIGMVGAFYSTHRIPVTLPIVIAITALCRLIIMQSKEMEVITLVGEAGAIAILSGSAYLMSIHERKISGDE